MTKKKNMLPFIIAGLVAIGLIIPTGVLVAKKFLTKAPQGTTTEQTKKKLSKPINVLPVAERPYVLVSPTANREIDVTVKRVVKEANELEYLAEYQYGTSLGGNENFIDLSDGLPATKQFALYSRSAGGKTSYEEDVQGGSLTLKFANPNDYWLKQEWNYYDRANAKSSTKESAVTSRDGKFSVAGNSLKGIKYIIVYNSPGYPAELSGQALSDVYTFQYAGTPAGKTIDVKFRMSQDGTGSVYGWDGTAWKEFDTTVEGQAALATVDIMEAYMVMGK